MSDTQTTDQTPSAPPEVSVEPTTSGEPFLVNGGTHVLMYNSATDGTWECPLDYTGQAVADGWTFANDPREAEVGTEIAEALAAHALDALPPVDYTTTAFDPAKAANVQVVNDYIEKSIAEGRPGEANRVIEAERAGKNRSSVIDPLTPAPTS